MAFEDGSFDTVISMFGAMFAPRPDKVGGELIRVCRSGGRIVMANWTAVGFAGKMFKLMASYVPPPPMTSPVLWGDEAIVRERLKDGIADLQLNRRLFPSTFPFSPAEVVAHFRTFFGPTQLAFAALENDKINKRLYAAILKTFTKRTMSQLTGLRYFNQNIWKLSHGANSRKSDNFKNNYGRLEWNKIRVCRHCLLHGGLRYERQS